MGIYSKLWKLGATLGVAYSSYKTVEHFFLETLDIDDVLLRDVLFRHLTQNSCSFDLGSTALHSSVIKDRVTYEDKLCVRKGLPTNRILLYKNRIPIFLTHVKNKNDADPIFRIEYFRGTLDLYALIRQASVEYTENQSQGSFYTFHMSATEDGISCGEADFESPIREADWIVEPPPNESKESYDLAWELAFTEAQKRCVQELDRWKGNPEWYLSRGIPWKRGYLFYGPPGSGKTTFARALGMRLQIPVVTFDLSSFTDAVFREAWDDVAGMGPRIILLEDLDAVFSGRENVHGSDHLTWSCILNCIAGVKDADGMVLIVTSNYPEKLDSALATRNSSGNIQVRPGRIDKAIYFGDLTEEAAKKVTERIFPERPDLAEEMMEKFESCVAAEFQEKCLARATEEFWKVPMKKIKIARDFTRTPGPRYIHEGEDSAEEFLNTLALEAFDGMVEKGGKLVFDLDGTLGYGTAFLEHTFRTLAERYGVKKFKETVGFISKEEPYLIEDIKEYVEACNGCCS